MNAFKELVAECRAVLAFEHELREISVLGNTNVNVFKLKVEAAERELGEARAAIEGDACPDGLLPDGPKCPRCGGKRAPSGIGGGTWVHLTQN